MSAIGRWALVAFFFFGGIAFVAFEPTREIYIGQIWIAVSIFVAIVYILAGLGGAAGAKAGATLDLSRWTGNRGKAAGPAAPTAEPPAAEPAPAVGANTAAKQLERLESLHQKGDLTDAEYQSQRDRIISEAS